jgi:hypothetical protein
MNDFKNEIQIIFFHLLLQNYFFVYEKEKLLIENGKLALNYVVLLNN